MCLFDEGVVGSRGFADLCCCSLSVSWVGVEGGGHPDREGSRPEIYFFPAAFEGPFQSTAPLCGDMPLCGCGGKAAADVVEPGLATAAAAVKAPDPDASSSGAPSSSAQDAALDANVQSAERVLNFLMDATLPYVRVALGYMIVGVSDRDGRGDASGIPLGPTAWYAAAPSCQCSDNSRLRIPQRRRAPVLQPLFSVVAGWRMMRTSRPRPHGSSSRRRTATATGCLTLTRALPCRRLTWSSSTRDSSGPPQASAAVEFETGIRIRGDGGRKGGVGPGGWVGGGSKTAQQVHGCRAWGTGTWVGRMLIARARWGGG